MVSASRAAHNIEITAESLQEDLARLEVQKQALERELAAVVAHLGSVQRALSALEVLMAGTAAVAPADVARAAAAAPDQTVVSPSASADVAPKTEPKARQPKGRQAAKAPAAHSTPSSSGASSASPDSTEADSQRTYGKLTEHILEYFATVGTADVRARDVAAALGRDADSGSINAVRSTLDRLVGTSRIRRTGRGLYRAKRS
ncbi:hypothetical protein [Streptomyces sp. FIT100]|uniref:hypothetical protein n=1 Tax=Streptomyces sp. FIT100 TaxID=2837956 RepID=UPI0021C74499|nr:hypothetical protein [Streptomyces sp. FIT100]UUN25242.1 hypothetical protein KK483_01555 [Streptomyces sp. FIT100]